MIDFQEQPAVLGGSRLNPTITVQHVRCKRVLAEPWTYQWEVNIYVLRAEMWTCTCVTKKSFWLVKMKLLRDPSRLYTTTTLPVEHQYESLHRLVVALNHYWLEVFDQWVCIPPLAHICSTCEHDWSQPSILSKVLAINLLTSTYMAPQAFVYQIAGEDLQSLRSFTCNMSFAEPTAKMKSTCSQKLTCIIILCDWWNNW